ncbi:MAG: hypothetical protein R3F22_03870 [Lysobacteraceae bacterium]
MELPDESLDAIKVRSPATLELRDWPDPVPAADEVRIRIRAASINPIDYKLMRGDLKRIQPVRFT